MHPDNYELTKHPPDDSQSISGYVDSDWAGDTSHHKLVTRITIMFACGMIGFKTHYQDTILHSSMELDFVAACDVGK